MPGIHLVFGDTVDDQTRPLGDVAVVPHRLGALGDGHTAGTHRGVDITRPVWIRPRRGCRIRISRTPKAFRNSTAAGDRSCRCRSRSEPAVRRRRLETEPRVQNAPELSWRSEPAVRRRRLETSAPKQRQLLCHVTLGGGELPVTAVVSLPSARADLSIGRHELERDGSGRRRHGDLVGTSGWPVHQQRREHDPRGVLHSSLSTHTTNLSIKWNGNATTALSVSRRMRQLKRASHRITERGQQSKRR
jgi:hypothetical protein